MKEEKNLMSCFDDDIGDDFLSSWKPSNMSSIPNLDFECSQLNAPEKTFKLPENFDLDMPDFGTGLNSKLSSFDIDFDFLKSPKHVDSAKEIRGEALTTLSQTSSDALQASSGHDASALSGRERDDVAQSRHGKEDSSMQGHAQVDAKISCKGANSGETLALGSQTEMAKTPVDSSEKRVLKETANDTIKGTPHDSSVSELFEEAIQLVFSQELLDTAGETSGQSREGAIGHKNASALSAQEQQEQNLSPAQAISKEKNTVAGEIVSDKDAEEVTFKKIETKAERRSFRGTLQGATEEESFELQSAAEGVTSKHIETKSERRSVRGTVQEITKEQSLELQPVGLATNIVDVIMQTDLQPHCYKDSGNSYAMVPEMENDEKQTGLTDREPWKDIATGQVTKTSEAEHTQVLKTSSMLTKDSKKVDALNSSSPRGAKLKFAAPKHSLSKAFMSLKPTQVSALRTSRSHALQPLRFEKHIGDPSSRADDEELQSTLKAQVNAETRSSLQTSRPSLPRTSLIKKRGPLPIEQSADHTQATADVPERSVNEAPEKRPKLQAAHRTEQESNELKLLNAGHGKVTKMPIPAIEMLNISKHIPQAAGQSQSRPPSSLSRLTSLTRVQQNYPGSTSAARIELPRPEDIFVATNSLCVQSSLSHGQAVDPATAEIVKKNASGMNHKPESIYHGIKKSKNHVSHSLLKKARDNLTDVMTDKCEVVENTGYHKIEEKPGSHPPVMDSRGGCADSKMHDEAECNLKANFGVPCPQLLLEDIMQGQTCAKEITRDSKSISKTTAYYSVELDKIMSMLKQKQRRANDLLAEAMAHNAKMKYLLDSKNQEKIILLQKSIAERLEGVKLQTAGNRAKKCEWCEEHREDEAAALIKERCNSVH